MADRVSVEWDALEIMDRGSCGSAPENHPAGCVGRVLEHSLFHAIQMMEYALEIE
jgi:hypothetical protein